MSRQTILIIGAIVFFGALLRFSGLGSAELVFDEGLYAFRSIGYLDYLESALQPTPVQWLAEQVLPWWTKLSFHDHPPLFFLSQKVFFSLFGDSLLIARLPSALGGIVSMILIFAIAKKFSGSDLSGFGAAVLWAVMFAPVLVSRLSMMEGLLFPLILLNIYLFLLFSERPGKWIWFGVSLGLAFLTKYTSVFLVPVYLAYLISTRSPLLKNRRLYGAFLLALAVFLPVIAYNFNFYRAFGHFDLQFSYLFGQEVPEWQGVSGKTQEPFSALGENFFILFSKKILLVAFASLAVLLFALKTVSVKAARVKEGTLFSLLLALFITLLLLAIGSAIRFTALYAIPIILFIALALPVFRERLKNKGLKITLIAAAAFLLFSEGALTFDRLFRNALDYGVSALDKYFNEEIGDARGPGLPKHPNQHLNLVIQKYGSKHPATLPPPGLIYDDDIGTGPLLWVFARRQYYHGIPIMPASAFLDAVAAKGNAAFSGFNLYAVIAGPGAPLKSDQATEYGEEVERMINEKGKIVPDLEISDADGNLAFTIYRILIK